MNRKAQGHEIRTCPVSRLLHHPPPRQFYLGRQVASLVGKHQESPVASECQGSPRGRTSTACRTKPPVCGSPSPDPTSPSLQVHGQKAAWEDPVEWVRDTLPWPSAQQDQSKLYHLPPPTVGPLSIASPPEDRTVKDCTPSSLESDPLVSGSPPRLRGRAFQHCGLGAFPEGGAWRVAGGPGPA